MIKVGIVGSGFGLYGLLPAFASLKGCQVVAVYAKNQQRLKEHYFSKGYTKVYSDWRKMLDTEQLDALALAVTPVAQYEIAKYAIQKGMHIFAEKPLADSLSHAKTLHKLAVKKNITHAVDFLFPEIDQWQAVKAILDEKRYGKLTQITTNWDFLSFDIKNQIATWKTDISKGGGALSFYFCHVLYYLEYFAGEIKEVKSSLLYSKNSPNGGDVGLNLLLRFKDNVSGSAHFSCNTVGLTRHQLLFICEHATIVLENSDSFVRNFEITIYTSHGKKSISFKKQSLHDEAQAKVLLVKEIAKRFLLACNTNSQIHPSFKEGLHVQELISKIRKNSST